MYSIVKEWKSFRVYLPGLRDWLQENVGTNFVLAADSAMTIWFEEQPGYEVEDAIHAEWSLLTEEGEAAKWELFEAREAVVETARTALLTADLTTTIPAERKLLMGMTLSDDDKDNLILKYS